MTISTHAQQATLADQTYAAISGAISRGEFFAGLFIVGCANGIGGNIMRAVIAGDWTGGVENISAIVWFACFAGISLVLDKARDQVRLADVLAGMLFLALMLAPA